MKFSTLTSAIALGAGGLVISGAVLAGAVTINESMSRRPAGSVSGDGVSTVEANCPTDPGGNDWQDATAEVMVRQVGGGSTVDIDVKNAVPDTVFTVWLRIRGGADWNRDVNGNAGSPLTGGGATPLAPGSALDGLNEYSPWGSMPAGSANPTNGFTTNSNGNGQFSVDLDFPVLGGAYPFQATATSRPGFEGVPNVAHAIPTPGSSPGTPFLFRVISHCTDQVGHGLSPGTREAWFQYP